jgi:hypothetical protein
MRVITFKKKKIVFISILIFLASFFFTIPSSLAYGSSFNNALTIQNGTYYEILDYYDDYAYYKVFCRPGDSLFVVLTVDYPSYDLDLYLYDSSNYLEDSSTDAADDDYVYGYPTTRGAYYIRVTRYSPSTGFVDFTLQVSGATGSEIIPGFEIYSLLVVIISTIALIYLRIKRKK